MNTPKRITTATHVATTTTHADETVHPNPDRKKAATTIHAEDHVKEAVLVRYRNGTLQMRHKIEITTTRQPTTTPTQNVPRKQHVAKTVNRRWSKRTVSDNARRCADQFHSATATIKESPRHPTQHKNNDNPTDTQRVNSKNHDAIAITMVQKKTWHQMRCCQILVSAETLKACALIGLHLLAADYEVRSSGGQSRDLGDVWNNGCPKSPMFSSRVRQVPPLVTMRSMGTTTSAGPMKSLGRIGQGTSGIELPCWTFSAKK